MWFPTCGSRTRYYPSIGLSGSQPVVLEPFGVRKIFQGVREKMSAMVYFLSSQFYKAMRNSVSFATAQVQKNYSSSLFFDP
jgi:hypothetical protein